MNVGCISSLEGAIFGFSVSRAKTRLFISFSFLLHPFSFSSAQECQWPSSQLKTLVAGVGRELLIKQSVWGRKTCWEDLVEVHRVWVYIHRNPWARPWMCRKTVEMELAPAVGLGLAWRCSCKWQADWRQNRCNGRQPWKGAEHLKRT